VLRDLVLELLRAGVRLLEVRLVLGLEVLQALLEGFLLLELLSQPLLLRALVSDRPCGAVLVPVGRIVVVGAVSVTGTTAVTAA
jgi:hypothetical protein